MTAVTIYVTPCRRLACPPLSTSRHPLRTHPTEALRDVA